MSASTSSAGTTAGPTSTYTPFTITSFPRNPLTTTFTPTDKDCSGVSLPTQLMIFMIHDQTSCLPSGFTSAERSFFSPGVACPSGYWSACHDNTGVPSITTVTCCPTYGSDVSLSCLNPATLAGRWQSLFCTWTAGTRTKVIDVTESLTGRTSTTARTMTGVQGLNAYGVRMVYQSSDLVTGQTGTGTSQNSQNPTSTPPGSTGPGSETPGSGGLATGAAIAIGVVIPLVVLAVAAGLFLLWRKRRQQRQNDIAPTAAADYTQKPETHFYAGPPTSANQAPLELPTPQNAAEMSTTNLAVELPAEQRPLSRQHHYHQS